MATLIRRLGLAALVPLVLVLSCSDAVAPRDGAARLIVHPSFAATSDATAGQNPASHVDNVRVLVSDEDGVSVIDRVIDWPVSQDTLRIEIELEVDGAQAFDLELHGRSGSLILFRAGPIRLNLVAGAGPPVQVAPVLHYVGPGAQIRDLVITGVPSEFPAGSQVQLGVLGVLDDGSQVADPPVEWSSDDPAAATVSEDGVVTVLHDAGRNVSITARLPFVDVARTITGPIRPSQITVSADESLLTAIGEQVQAEATPTGADGAPVTNAVITWESRNPAVAQVLGTDAGGTEASIGAVGRGTAWIIARTGEALDSVLITVTQVSDRVDVSPDAIDFDALGDRATASATAVDRHGNLIADPDIAWTSRDPQVASVDARGQVTARGVGSTWIVATAGAAADSLQVTVRQVIHSLTVSPTALTVEIGSSGTLEASARDRTGNLIQGLTYEWRSDDPSIATVNPLGQTTAFAFVTGVDPGTTMIQVSTGGLVASAVVTVMEPFELQVTKIGSGTVESNPPGISITAVGTQHDSARYPGGTVVVLTATPGSSNLRPTWGGDCIGTDPTCTLVMDQDRSASVSFSTFVERVHDLQICDVWSVASSGGQGTTIDVWNIDAIPRGAVFDIAYNAFGIPDKYVVEYPFGTVALDTGWRGSSAYEGNPLYPGGIAGPGQGQELGFFEKQDANQFRVTVHGPEAGTAWNYQIRCRMP